MSSFQERFKNKIATMGKDGIMGINNNAVLPSHDDYNFEIKCKIST